MNFTVGQLSEIFGVNKDTIRRYARGGKFGSFDNTKAKKDGYTFSERNIENFLLTEPKFRTKYYQFLSSCEKADAEIRKINAYIWHRCKDELPKNNGLYYVTDFTGRAFCCSYGFWPDYNSQELNKGWYYFEDPKNPYDGIVNMDRNIIAWCELPEPYREDF